MIINTIKTNKIVSALREFILTISLASLGDNSTTLFSIEKSKSHYSHYHFFCVSEAWKNDVLIAPACRGCQKILYDNFLTLTGANSTTHFFRQEV
ncbi:MAG: hypothetical protein WC412_05680 [Candidatus Omnitrophota bacterium]